MTPGRRYSRYREGRVAWGGGQVHLAREEQSTKAHSPGGEEEHVPIPYNSPGPPSGFLQVIIQSHQFHSKDSALALQRPSSKSGEERA